MIGQNRYENLRGATVRATLPNRTIMFAKMYVYPDGSRMRAGTDLEALKYLSLALNFQFQ